MNENRKNHDDPMTVRFNRTNPQDQELREYLSQFERNLSGKLKALAYRGLQYNRGELKKKVLIDEFESRIERLLDKKLGAGAVTDVSQYRTG